MGRRNVKRFPLVMLGGIGVAACVLGLFRFCFASRADAPAEPQNYSTELKEFARFEPIDAHTHAFKSDAAFYAMIKRLRLHLLDICVADSHNLFRALGPEIASARAFIRGSDGHASLCTTFDPEGFVKPNFAAEAIRKLNENFDQGAVAVKIWKNIGMELKTPEGKYVLPDDPVFEPIFEDIAAHNKTLVAHIAEPTVCWRPLDPADPSSDYYKEHPEWYMYIHPERPSKETLLTARDRMLEKHPTLRVVGAHLGSMELELDEIAKHFDRYPNFAVDTAARVEYLMLQPKAKVRDFLIRYQDRVLYATDEVFQTNDSAANARQEWLHTYERDWKFFATDEALDYQGRSIQGLKLPEPVLKKMFHENAVRWIPGILPPS
jgi:predicted TIM-barrel fold metal-dependent hydrolase